MLLINFLIFSLFIKVFIYILFSFSFLFSFFLSFTLLYAFFSRYFHVQKYWKLNKDHFLVSYTETSCILQHMLIPRWKINKWGRGGEGGPSHSAVASTVSFKWGITACPQLMTLWPDATSVRQGMYSLFMHCNSGKSIGKTPMTTLNDTPLLCIW